MTDHFADLAGVHVTAGRLTIPRDGPWHADVTLEKEVSVAPVGVALKFGNIAAVCSPYRAPIPFQGTTHVRLIGGYAGWRREIPEKGYKLAGMRLSFLLAEVAKAVGERVIVGNDFALGNHYLRDKAPACRTLNRWCAGAWWIDLDGTTRTGVRPSSPIASHFDLVTFDGARGVAVVATETPGDFMPGRTFRASNLPQTLTVDSVTHTLVSDKIRTEVLVA